VRFLKIQISPLETDLAEIWTGTSGNSFGFLVFLVLLVFWFFGTSQKLGFDFSKALSNENMLSRCQNIHWGRVHFSIWFLGKNVSPTKIPNFLVQQQWHFFLSSERCSLQFSSYNMLIFELLLGFF
jgi:hypothetical protein